MQRFCGVMKKIAKKCKKILQKQKFGYLYKFNADRMAHTSIMLPVTDAGQPDYDFMESFGRKMMSNKYSQYLSFLALPVTTN